MRPCSVLPPRPASAATAAGRDRRSYRFSRLSGRSLDDGNGCSHGRGRGQSGLIVVTRGAPLSPATFTPSLSRAAVPGRNNPRMHAPTAWAHARPEKSHGDRRLRIRCVILVPLDIRLHILRRHQPHLMAQCATALCGAISEKIGDRDQGVPCRGFRRLVQYIYGVGAPCFDFSKIPCGSVLAQKAEC